MRSLFHRPYLSLGKLPSKSLISYLRVGYAKCDTADFARLYHHSVLTFQFYEKKNSLGQRLNILTALALGAQELSGFDQPAFPLPKRQSGSSSKNSNPATASTSLATPRPTFDNITSTISLSRTRRFSQKSNIEASRPAPKANAFGNLAPVFLGGLLGRWGGNRGAGAERGYDALQRAPVMVLKKFVVTLGVLVHYSGM